MNTNKRRTGGSAKRSGGRPLRRPSHASPRNAPTSRATRATPNAVFKVDSGSAVIVASECDSAQPASVRPFRVLIAVHRPRYRGRAERACGLVGWEVTSLLNKQDVVGQVAKQPGPPDLVVVSGDFGRQRDYAIFRAVQPWRKQGMRLIGMVADCQSPPADYPDSAPEKLCDICLTPPYTTPDLRAHFCRLYEEMRGAPAPPAHSASNADRDDEPDD